jgi:hypothetical protein
MTITDTVCIVCRSTHVQRKLDSQTPGAVACVCRECGAEFVELFVSKEEMKVVSDEKRRARRK